MNLHDLLKSRQFQLGLRVVAKVLLAHAGYEHATSADTVAVAELLGAVLLFLADLQIHKANQ